MPQSVPVQSNNFSNNNNSINNQNNYNQVQGNDNSNSNVKNIVIKIVISLVILIILGVIVYFVYNFFFVDKEEKKMVNNNFLVENEGKVAIFNTNGEQLTDFIYDVESVYNPFINDSIILEKDGNSVFIDSDGKEIFVESEELSIYDDGPIYIVYGLSAGIYSSEGKLLYDREMNSQFKYSYDILSYGILDSSDFVDDDYAFIETVEGNIILINYDYKEILTISKPDEENFYFDVYEDDYILIIANNILYLVDIDEGKLLFEKNVTENYNFGNIDYYGNMYFKTTDESLVDKYILLDNNYSEINFSSDCDSLSEKNDVIVCKNEDDNYLFGKKFVKTDIVVSTSNFEYIYDYGITLYKIDNQLNLYNDGDSFLINTDGYFENPTVHGEYKLEQYYIINDDNLEIYNLDNELVNTVSGVSDVPWVSKDFICVSKNQKNVLLNFEGEVISDEYNSVNYIIENKYKFEKSDTVGILNQKAEVVLSVSDTEVNNRFYDFKDNHYIVEYNDGRNDYYSLDDKLIYSAK